jgi:DsbC/DsbD-like thiol-disulfide interchange protein
MKEEFNRYGKPQEKKDSNRNSENKKFMSSNKKYRGKPLQQTRKRGKQNLRFEVKIDAKEKAELLDKRLKC